MQCSRTLPLAILILLPQTTHCFAASRSAPSGLMCELMSEPAKTRISDSRPDFGWIVPSLDQNDAQTAYQVLVASDLNEIEQERGDMWHSDIKYGPYLTLGGVKKQIYLVSFLDDATRYVVHGEFYDSLDQTVVEDCFRKAVLKEGVPRRVYFDNGKQYRTKWMGRACAVLGIRLLYAKPYSPESTGKIERFNRTVDSFLAEVALKNCRTLEDFNRYFSVWLQECYHARKHGGLGTAPELAYKNSKAPLNFLSPEIIASAFMRVEQRKVDKSGCISFGAKKYEVGIIFVGRTVDVVYDPADLQTLTVEHAGTSVKVHELTIGEHTGPRPQLPKSMLPALPQTSRLLDEKEKQYENRRETVRRAIRFSGLSGKGGGSNV